MLGGTSGEYCVCALLPNKYKCTALCIIVVCIDLSNDRISSSNLATQQPSVLYSVLYAI